MTEKKDENVKRTEEATVFVKKENFVYSHPWHSSYISPPVVRLQGSRTFMGNWDLPPILQ